MKKNIVAVAVLMLFAAALVTGCKLGDNTTDTYNNVCKFTDCTVRFEDAAESWQHYSVTLHRSASATASQNSEYSAKTVTLKLILITSSGGGYTLSSGNYSLGSAKTPNTILTGDGTSLCIASETSYGEDFTVLSDAEISVSSYDGTYQIEGTVSVAGGLSVQFSYFGHPDFLNIPQEQQPGKPLSVIDFESAVLGASSQYSDILWGRELAEQLEDGTCIYDGLLYSEAEASFGSYYSYDGQWETWGGFAISNNRNTDDLGYDYSNQFSVYARQNSTFAVGYVFGDWGGHYANPIIEFSAPVTVVSADIANANKMYHYCNANPVVGFDDNAQPLKVDLVITGFDAQGAETGSVICTLAAEGRVLDDWTSADLSALGRVSRLTFGIDSNDVGEYGLNVPAFFCLDNIAYRQ